MKRSLLLTLIMAVVALALVTLGVRLSSSTDVSAHFDPAVPHLEIDLVKDGTEWCDPVDATADHYLNSDYQVAICLTGAAKVDQTPWPPQAFNFDFFYDQAKNTCPDVTCPEVVPGTGLYTCPDDNPDINDGTTVFSSPDLGTGWDCNAADQPAGEPQCDIAAATSGAGSGQATISCASTSAGTLPVGVDKSAAIAVINLHATAAGGLDNLTLDNVAVFGAAGAKLFECYGSGPCYGAADNKTAPPTPTPLPAECDFADLGMTATASSLNIKVGDPPVKFTVTENIKNEGAFNPGAPEMACQVGIIWGAALATADPDVQLPIPAALNVRVEPFGQSILVGGGDLCTACIDPTDPVTVCMLGLPGVDWMYAPCDELGLGTYKVSLDDDSCLTDGDNTVPPDNKCDWDGLSTCALGPDPNCVDVHALAMTPLIYPTVAVDETITRVRDVYVECKERGTFPLFIFGSTYPPTSTPPAPPIPFNDPNAENDISYTIVNVTCTKGPEMVKDADVTTEEIETEANLWLMDPDFAGKTTPETLPAADDNGCVIAEEGKGCLAVDVWLKSADDEDDLNDSDDIPECLGAWEDQVKYEHKILRLIKDLLPVTVDTDDPADTVPDAAWIESTGRIANCTMTILTENYILEGCVTKDDPQEDGIQVGVCGDGILERMLLVPQTSDLIYRDGFRPTKDNGVVTDILDENCEITDIYAEPMADTLPGGLTPVCGDIHVTVRMLQGDIDLDCDVDVVDDQAMAFRYGSFFGLQLYDQWFDLEPKFADFDIDIKDLQFVFGRNYSTCQAPIPDDQATPVDPRDLPGEP